MASVMSVWMPLVIANIWLVAVQFIKDKKQFKQMAFVGIAWIIIAVFFSIAYRLNIAWLG